MNYRGTKYWARFKFLDVEEQFEPAVGFINRRSGLDGFRRYDLYARYRPRPKFGNIRYMSIGPEAQIFTDRNNNVKYWTAELSVFAIFNTGDYWRIELNRTRDVVDEAFPPSARREDVVIPPGIYTFSSFVTGPRPSRSRKLRPGITFEAGTYYTGRRYTIRSESTFRPSGQLSYEMEYQGDWIRLPQGNLNIHTLSNRLQYSFSTDFLSNSLCNGTTTKNSQARIFSSTTGIDPAATFFSSSTALMAPIPTLTRRKPLGALQTLLSLKSVNYVSHSQQPARQPHLHRCTARQCQCACRRVLRRE